MLLRLPPVLFAIALVSAGAVGKGKPIVWVVSGLCRVSKTADPGALTYVSLKAARGEYEPFQIVLRASSGELTHVNVNASILVGRRGQIPASAFQLYREHYVYIDKSSHDLGPPNRPSGIGWYPDALIPFTDPETGQRLSGSIVASPFSVVPGQNQPIWVDLLIPRTVPPGQYSGSISVTSDQGTVMLPISVMVWNFELPLKPSLNSSFQFWPDNGMRGLKSANSELMRHKIMPLSVRAADMTDLMHRFGGSIAGLPFFSGANWGNCVMKPAPTVAAIRQVVSAYPAGVALYSYIADEIEPCSNLFESVRIWARNFHAAGVRTLITMPPSPNLFDDGTGRPAVDIWAVPSSSFDRAAPYIAQAQSLGMEVWSYNGSTVQEAYSPKWDIDFDLINFRIQPGFISESLNLKGLLYWRVDRWSANPWNQVNNTGVFGPDNFPGEGMLVYPGQQVGLDGVVPSLRLKQIREGIEDFEMIEILKKLGRGDWALNIARTVGADWHNWSRDPGFLAAARLRLGDEIERIMALNHTPPASRRFSRRAKRPRHDS